MSTTSPYLMPSYARQPVAFTRGAGAWLWDEQGRAYLDAIAGVAVTNLGHAHPEISRVITEQAGLLLHTSNQFGIPWQARLGEQLCALAGMERAFFCNSGAEANETALKLARLHGQRRGIAQPHVVVMDNAFHGRTLATLAASGNPAIQQGYAPLLPGFIRVPFNDEAALTNLESNPEIAAVLIEPVQGEAGVHIASPAYLQQLRQLCNQHGWLLMLDEIQTGLGRTGRWFGHQHAGITPDVITVAKALGNGLPIGACLARGPAATLFTPGSHGSTFGGNPLACRVSSRVLELLAEEATPERAAAQGQHLLSRLRTGLAHCNSVRDIRGLGLMIGIELNAPCKPLATQALHDEALIINVTREQTIRLLPALICSDAELDEMADKLIRAVKHYESRATASDDKAKDHALLCNAFTRSQQNNSHLA